MTSAKQTGETKPKELIDVTVFQIILLADKRETIRYGELKGLLGLSDSTLSLRLKKMVAAGLLELKVVTIYGGRHTAAYALTKKGREDAPIIRRFQGDFAF